MSADKQLKAYIDRVLRLKEEQDTLGDDIREVYAEAKSAGYDKTAMGKLVAHLRKVSKAGESAVSEQEMVFDTYLQAYHRASGTAVATHTHEEEFDPTTGEFVDDNEASDGSPSVPPLAGSARDEESAVSNHSRPAALAVSGGEPSIPSPDAGGEKMDGYSHPGRSDDMSAYCNAQSGQATNSIFEVGIPTSLEKATVATQGEATKPTSAEREDSAAASTLPDKPKVSYRPNCQHPENCASGTRDHCWSCRRAMQKSEEMA